MPIERIADADDLPHTEWECDNCGAMNSMWDAECQFCDYHDTVDEVPCTDNKGHTWVVSDENENICYCEKCGTMEY